MSETPKYDSKLVEAMRDAHRVGGMTAALHVVLDAMDKHAKNQYHTTSVDYVRAADFVDSFRQMILAPEPTEEDEVTELIRESARLDKKYREIAREILAMQKRRQGK